MRKEINELRTHVEKFFILLENHPDSVDSTFVFIRFLRSFLRENTQKGVLPTIEIMTLLKEHKPVVFQTMRKLSERDKMLGFLTGLSMNVRDAENKLESIYEGADKNLHT